MNTQDFIETLQLCRLLNIKTLGELAQFKEVCQRRYKNFTNKDLLAELEKRGEIK